VLEALRAEVCDTKPRRAFSRLERVVLSALGLAVGIVLFSFRALGTEPMVVAVSTLTFSCLAAALLFSGVIPGAAKWEGGTRRLMGAALSLGLLVVLFLQAEHFSTFNQFFSSGVSSAARCALHAFASGLIATLALMLVWRRTDPFSPGTTGAMLGLFGGLAGAVSIELTCHNGEGLHLTLGHGLAALVLAGAGYLVGRKWLTP
jgi:hypothetical protein